ncbi:translation initiation factor IF-2-like [Passer montanus]|uniref:translation initiation factor IF-2-like n=1 Tax=Passer montanus TaxID=9160 RepID=UPI0019613693|nr:translation initiation factor IF-2-like [Passer montanus]
MAPAPSMRERAATAPQEGPQECGRSGTGAAAGLGGPWLDAAGGAAAACGLWAASFPLTPKEGCAATCGGAGVRPAGRPPARPGRHLPEPLAPSRAGRARGESVRRHPSGRAPPRAGPGAQLRPLCRHGSRPALYRQRAEP